jgi:phospholipid/cholesterol/gamma-HCH transport system substrate-binding protein
VTDRLARGEGTAGRLVADSTLYNRADSLVERLDRLTAELEAGHGTAGRLLRDERLYENLDAAAAELRALLADIRRDPEAVPERAGGDLLIRSHRCVRRSAAGAAVARGAHP